MNGRAAKKARQEIKNLLQERMDNGQKEQIDIQHVVTFINLHQILTGKKPDKIELTEVIYASIIQQIQGQIDNLGGKMGFKDDKPSLLGVPIEKKTTIAIGTPAIHVPGNN